MGDSHWAGNGNLADDPKLGQTNNGTSVLNFRMGANVYGGGEDRTLWVNCAIFGNRADSLANILCKGKQVAVRGTLYEREYDRQDGSVGHALECTVDQLTLCGAPDQQRQGQGQRNQGPPPQQRSGNGQQRPPQRQQQGNGQRQAPPPPRRRAVEEPTDFNPENYEDWGGQQ